MLMYTCVPLLHQEPVIYLPTQNFLKPSYQLPTQHLKFNITGIEDLTRQKQFIFLVKYSLLILLCIFSMG